MSAINICQNICGNENVLWCGYCCAVVWLAWAVAGQLLLVLIMGPGQAVIMGPGQAVIMGPGQAVIMGPGQAVIMGPGQAVIMGPGQAVIMGPGRVSCCWC